MPNKLHELADRVEAKARRLRDYWGLLLLPFLMFAYAKALRFRALAESEASDG